MWSPTQKMWLTLQHCLRGVGHDIQVFSVRDCGQLLGREDAGKMPWEEGLAEATMLCKAVGDLKCCYIL